MRKMLKEKEQEFANKYTTELVFRRIQEEYLSEISKLEDKIEGLKEIVKVLQDMHEIPY